MADPATDLNVLLVEGDCADKARLAGALPARFSTARTARAAVDLMQRQNFDVVIADPELQDSRGLETIALLRDANEDTPIIVLTGDSDERAATALMQQGAQDYLVRGRTDTDLLRRALRYAMERRRIERRVEFLSQFDRLTCLPNRELFRDRLIQAAARASRSGQSAALLFLDLDRFKAVNETLGHATGDELLVAVTQRLRQCVRETDTISRFGGDEFTIILEELSDPSHASTVATKILASLTPPFVLNGYEIFVTGSIGITLCPGDGTDIATLQRNADAAMYRAKQAGRNKYHYYTADMNTKALERLALEADLRRAVERDAFYLCYQPKVCLETGHILGVEALVRWADPQRGTVSPADFIPLAEETGLIVPIGEWVLQEACQQHQQWQQLGLGSVKIAVNLSARQFLLSDLPSKIGNILAETGAEAECIELEITESLLMEDMEISKKTLQELRSMGMSIVIDDFGTGYSSLGYLKQFPIDCVKIDRSFVKDLPSDADDAAITRAIIALASALRLDVVAEGVETAEQLAFLTAERCHIAQGYLFSKPLPADAITQVLTHPAWNKQKRKTIELDFSPIAIKAVGA